MDHSKFTNDGTYISEKILSERTGLSLSTLRNWRAQNKARHTYASADLFVTELTM